MGILLRQALEQFLRTLRKGSSLILKYKMIASNHGFPAVDRGGNTMCHHILHLGMHFLMIQTFFPGCLNNRFCHGMWEMLLHAGCNPKKLIRAVPVKGNHFCHGRLCLGQCAGLIKDDCISLSHCL